MKFRLVLSFGVAAAALVGCSTVDDEPWAEGVKNEFPEDVIPRAVIVGAEDDVAGTEVATVPVTAPEAAPAVPAVDVASGPGASGSSQGEVAVEVAPAMTPEMAELVTRLQAEQRVNKQKRGWWPFGRKEKKVTPPEVEVVAAPAPVPVETETVPEPEPEEVVVAEEPAVEAEEPLAKVEKKKRGWWPFGRKKDEVAVAAVAEEADSGEGVEGGAPEAKELEAEVEAAPEPERPVAKSLAWKLRFPGVDLLEIERREPRLMRGWAVRVNAADVEWKLTEGNGDKDGETSGLRTSTFLKDYRCDLAVNGAPFAPIELFEEQPQDIVGLHVSNGVVVSGPDGRKPVLAFDRNGRGSVLEAGSYGDGSALWDAVAGFSVVLRDGSVVGGGADVHPRTAAGVSRDGGTVYLLVIDGRQPGHSEGATTADLGRMLAEFGAWDGINLDGGGTTTMVVKGAGGKAEVLNKTINGGISGLERVSGSHLGLRVK